MSEKLEQIKQLQQDLFVEEHGVTKEQARKLNEFMYYEPTGEAFDFFTEQKINSPSVNSSIGGLKNRVERQNERICELEWEHKKLWMGFWVYIMLSTSAFVVLFRLF